MTRRHEDPLERALVGPARVISGYAAALTSWPGVEWLLHDPRGSQPPLRWIGLCLLMTAMWWLVGRRQRAMAARTAREPRRDPGEARPS